MGQFGSPSAVWQENKGVSYWRSRIVKKECFMYVMRQISITEIVFGRRWTEVKRSANATSCWDRHTTMPALWTQSTSAADGDILNVSGVVTECLSTSLYDVIFFSFLRRLQRNDFAPPVRHADRRKAQLLLISTSGFVVSKIDCCLWVSFPTAYKVILCP